MGKGQAKLSAFYDSFFFVSFSSLLKSPSWGLLAFDG
jgi:hypothetical protein